MSKDTFQLKLKPGLAGPVSLGLGALGLVGCIVGFLQDKKSFFASYLTAFSFFLAITLGSFFFTFVQYLARSSWSVTVRRISETIAGNFWVVFLLFLPLLAGVSDLFIWFDAKVRAEDHLVHAKAAYLNPTFALIRIGVAFAIWIAFGRYFWKKSTGQDLSGDPLVTNKLGRVAAGAAVLFALTQTIWALDWIMALDPHWFSTMFGVYYFAGSVVAQYCVLVLITSWLRSNSGRKDLFRRDHFHDLGKLLFGHNVFWTYIGFSQFMLIWYANIPEETMFFKHRADHGWKVVSLILPWCHFAIPFLYLMSWHVKRNIVAICVGCVWLLTVCYIDIYWLIQPNFHHAPHFGIGDVGAILFIGGVLFWAFQWSLSKVNLVPAGDPRLPECLSYTNGVVDERD
jgi:hypothetical protein